MSVNVSLRLLKKLSIKLRTPKSDVHLIIYYSSHHWQNWNQFIIKINDFILIELIPEFQEWFRLLPPPP